MSKYIPLSEPMLKGKEWQYVKECLDSTWISSAGKYVRLFEKKIAEYTESKFAVACVNGTSALQVSLRMIGVETGDEVIVSTLTFIAPVNAIAYNKATPIFMDVDQYYNIDAEKTIQFIKNETVFKDGSTYNKITNKKVDSIKYAPPRQALKMFGGYMTIEQFRNNFKTRKAPRPKSKLPPGPKYKPPPPSLALLP